MAMQERAVRTRTSLLRAAAAVFAEEGYVPSSLAAISKRAGVSNGALHFHFENKKALARAVEDQAADAVRRLVQPVHGAETGALQAVVDATYGLLGSFLDDIVVRAGFELGSQHALGPEARMLHVWHEWVDQTLHRAKAEGQLAPGVSPGDAAKAVVAVAVGLRVLAVGDPRWLAERRIAAFWELLLASIAAEPGRIRVRPRSREQAHRGRSGARRPTAAAPRQDPARQ
ncbi:regulatory protein (plasmid) [Streptomyces griseofuscus]|uniref:Regulatory protein n=1 Tax=Streptomyces griseofuscus TaxID=146922 RepID=A0A7H1QD01_9ACTN|nr:ScbR family autoregulator-binding transcription factor [Streptomyces griseofuscus]QNT98181.1 regulatory protein [Streptomyces griseofuscus]